MVRDLVAIGIGGTVTFALFCYVLDDILEGLRSWRAEKRISRLVVKQ